MRSFKRRDRGAQSAAQEARVVFDSAKMGSGSQVSRQDEECKISFSFSARDIKSKEISISKKRLSEDTGILNEREMLVKLALLKSGIPAYYEPYEFVSENGICAFYPDFITSLFINDRPVVIERHTSPAFPDSKIKNLDEVRQKYLDYIKRISKISKDYDFHLVFISQISKGEMDRRLGEDINNYVDDYWYVSDCLKHRLCFEFEMSGHVNPNFISNEVLRNIRDAALIDSDSIKHPEHDVPRYEIEIVAQHEGNVKTKGLVYVHTSFSVEDLSFLSCAIESISNLEIKDDKGRTTNRPVAFRTVGIENGLERVRKSRREEEEKLTNLIEGLKMRGKIDSEQLFREFLIFDKKSSDAIKLRDANKKVKPELHLIRKDHPDEHIGLAFHDTASDDPAYLAVNLPQEIGDKKLKRSVVVVNRREQALKDGILKYGIPAYYEPYQFKGERTKKIYPPDFLTGLFIDGKSVAIERHSSPRDDGDWASFKKYLEKLDDVRKTHGFHMVLVSQTPKGKINRMTGIDIDDYVDEYWFVNDPNESKFRQNRHTRHGKEKRGGNEPCIDYLYDARRERDRIESRLRSLLERGVIDEKLLDIRIARAIEKSKNIGNNKNAGSGEDKKDLPRQEELKSQLRDKEA